MKITHLWGQRLLAAYLIIAGLVALIPALNVIPGIIVALLGLAAGILILINR